MEIAATISNQLFALSVELRTKDDSSIPAWAPLLLASLLQAMVIRPLVATARHWFGPLVLKLEETCPLITIWFSASPLNTRVLQVLNQVTSEVIRILLSEQTSMWVLYLLAPHLFDLKLKLKVEVRMLRVMLLLLLESMARLLLRLAVVTSEFMDNVGRVHKHKPPNPVPSKA